MKTRRALCFGRVVVLVLNFLFYFRGFEVMSVPVGIWEQFSVASFDSGVGSEFLCVARVVLSCLGIGSRRLVCVFYSSF